MYVKWNSSKYHVLGQYGHVRPLEGGTKRASSETYGGGVKPMRTLCGAEILADNVCFDQLPQRVDPHKDVCHKCDVGIGAPKIDHAAEEAKRNEESKAWSDKFRARMAARNRKLFDEM